MVRNWEERVFACVDTVTTPPAHAPHLLMMMVAFITFKEVVQCP